MKHVQGSALRVKKAAIIGAPGGPFSSASPRIANLINHSNVLRDGTLHVAHDGGAPSTKEDWGRG